MKTLTEVTKKIEELQALDAKLRSENPDLKHGEYAIKDLPLKVILKLADKLKMKPSYTDWSKKIELRSYVFSDLKLDIEITSVPVERKTKPPVPVIQDDYFELKGDKLKKVTNVPF